MCAGVGLAGERSLSTSDARAFGTGEEVVFIDPYSDGSGMCMAGLYNAKIGLRVEIIFKKDQLPHLVNWQHWGKGEYVTGIEPATNPPIGQAQARANNELIFLESYETRSFDLEVKIFEKQNL